MTNLIENSKGVDTIIGVGGEVISGDFSDDMTGGGEVERWNFTFVDGGD